MVRIHRLEIVLILALLASGVLSFAVRRFERQVFLPKETSASTREKIQTAMNLEPDKLQEKVLAHPSVWWRFRVASASALILMFGILAASLRLFFCLLTGRPLYQPLGSPPEPSWSLQQIGRLVLLLVVLSQWVLLAEWAIAVRFHPRWLDPHVVTLGNTFLIDLVVLVLGGSLMLRSGKPTGEKAPFGAAVRFAVGGYLTFLPVLAVLVMIVSVLMKAFHYQAEPQAVFSLFLSEFRRPVVAWLLLLAAWVGPVAEEIFFRGLFYGWLRNRIGIRRALLFTAFLFACLHTDLASFVPIFALGLLFGWVYEKTGSLAAPVAIHILHNAGMLYLAFLIRTLASFS